MKINDENKYDWLSRYLENELEGKELEFFEQALSRDSALREELDIQQKAQEEVQKYLQEQEFRNIAQNVWQNHEDFIRQTFQEEGFSYLNPRVNGQKNNFYLHIILLFLLISSIILLVFFIFFRPEAPTKITDLPPDSLKNLKTPDLPEKHTEGLQPSDTSMPTHPSKNIEPSPSLAIRLDSIPEISLGQSYGFAPGPGQNRKMRPVLFYLKVPQGFAYSEQAGYLFDDTLRLYGNLRTKDLYLLYRENQEIYYLKVNADTFRLDRWENNWLRFNTQD